MKLAILPFLRGAAGLRGLAGPILDKELRVSSRRRRNYVLRFAYLSALTLFIGLMWAEFIRDAGDASEAYGASRMAEVGKQIVVCAVWFQFVAIQLLAVVLLSTAISDEVYRRTLSVLLTTPITSLQIVLGKLASKMLQLVLLMAISLPLLAVVRVFGGVPWSFVLAGLGLTLTATLFAGSLSLFFSLWGRRAYMVILATLGALAGVYLLLPGMTAVVLHDFLSDRILLPPLLHVNPFFGLAWLTDDVFTPGAGAGVFYSWPLACGIALAVSAALLAFTAAKVRRVAVRQMTGETGPSAGASAGSLPLPAGTAWPKASSLPADPPSSAGAGASLGAPGGAGSRAWDAPIRRVSDRPILWKELRAPFARNRTLLILFVMAALSVLGITYILCLIEGCLGDANTHIAYGVAFLVMGIVATAILSATVITTEKESGTWPILLLTPLSDWQIVLSKGAGVLRRVAPVWLLLFGHVALFSCRGTINPGALGHLALVAAWVVFFVTCTGLFFSATLKRTTTAIIMNLALVVALWIALPFVSALLGSILSDDSLYWRGLTSWILSGNPVVQTIAVLRAHMDISGLYGWPTYEWPGDFLTFWDATIRIALWGWCYFLVGATLAALAKRRLRRKVF